MSLLFVRLFYATLIGAFIPVPMVPVGVGDERLRASRAAARWRRERVS